MVWPNRLRYQDGSKSTIKLSQTRTCFLFSIHLSWITSPLPLHWGLLVPPSLLVGVVSSDWSLSAPLNNKVWSEPIKQKTTFLKSCLVTAKLSNPIYGQLLTFSSKFFKRWRDRKICFMSKNITVKIRWSTPVPQNPYKCKNSWLSEISLRQISLPLPKLGPFVSVFFHIWHTAIFLIGRNCSHKALG